MHHGRFKVVRLALLVPERWYNKLLSFLVLKSCLNFARLMGFVTKSFAAYELCKPKGALKVRITMNVDAV